MNDLKHIQEWAGVESGINFKIKHWGVPYMNEGNGMWNYYLILPKAQVPDDLWKALCLRKKTVKLSGVERSYETFDYYRHPWTNIDLHGGPTHYTITRFHGFQAIEVGCDYGHLWDMEAGYPYNIHNVELDARRSCKLLREHYPELRIRCQWTGNYVDPQEGEYLSNGAFRSFAANKSEAQ